MCAFPDTTYFGSMHCIACTGTLHRHCYHGKEVDFITLMSYYFSFLWLFIVMYHYIIDCERDEFGCRLMAFIVFCIRRSWLRRQMHVMHIKMHCLNNFGIVHQNYLSFFFFLNFLKIAQFNLKLNALLFTTFLCAVHG